MLFSWWNMVLSSFLERWVTNFIPVLSKFIAVTYCFLHIFIFLLLVRHRIYQLVCSLLLRKRRRKRVPSSTCLLFNSWFVYDNGGDQTGRSIGIRVPRWWWLTGGHRLTHRWPTSYVFPQDNNLSFTCCRWRIFIVFLPRSVGPGYQWRSYTFTASAGDLSGELFKSYKIIPGGNTPLGFLVSKFPCF